MEGSSIADPGRGDGLFTASWRGAFVAGVDHDRVIARIQDESGWSGRYLFMIAMSAGIAVLGLLLSSPAVVIGAMLISPLMNPILGLGFGLTLFDFAEVRRALAALAIGAVLGGLLHRADRAGVTVEGADGRNPRPHAAQPVRPAGRAVRRAGGELRDHPRARRDDHRRRHRHRADAAARHRSAMGWQRAICRCWVARWRCSSPTS